MTLKRVVSWCTDVFRMNIALAEDLLYKIPPIEHVEYFKLIDTVTNCLVEGAD